MPNPYMMQQGFPQYSPVQPGTFFQQPQNMGNQQNYPLYNANKQNVQPTTTTTTQSKFSLDAPIYTPKDKKLSTAPNTNKDLNNDKLNNTNTYPSNNDDKNTVEKENVRENVEIVGNNKVHENNVNPAPSEEVIPKTFSEEIDKPKEQNKPVEQTVQTPKKGGLGSLFTKTDPNVVKISPIIPITNVPVVKPVIKKKDDYYNNKPKNTLTKTTSQPQYEKKSYKNPKDNYTKEVSNYVEDEEEPIKEEFKAPEPKWDIVKVYFKVCDKKEEKTTKKRFDVDFLMHFKDVKLNF